MARDLCRNRTKARNRDFDTRPYTHKDAVKDALIMGMTDKKLMERALAEDPSHDTLMLWGQAREAGKEGVHNLSGGHSSANRIENFDDMSETEIENMIETVRHEDQKAREIQWTSKKRASQTADQSLQKLFIRLPSTRQMSSKWQGVLRLRRIKPLFQV